MELNEQVESESTESAEQSPQGASPEGESAPSPTAQEIIDLDKIEKFRYAGRELTPKELQGMVMMQSDYTRKTQSLAEERRYYDNLSADLASVKANPALLDKFKSIYPEKFHAYLDYVAPQREAAAPQAAQKPVMDPAFEERFNKMEQAYKAREVEAAEAQIDATIKTLAPKYPYASERAVLAEVQYALDKGQKLTEKVWEAAYKAVNDDTKRKVDMARQEELKNQKQANMRGKDVSQGGGIPGQAPKMPRTIKEATAYALQELENA